MTGLKRRPARGQHYARNRRRILVSLLLVGAPLALAGGTVLLKTQPVVAAVPLSQSQFQSAVASFTSGRLHAIGVTEDATSAVASARLVLNISAGRVLSETSRAELSSDILRESAKVDRAAHQIERGTRMADFAPSGTYFSAPPGFAEKTAMLGGYKFTAADSLADVRAALVGPVQGVTVAVAAWQTEQARLAAEAAARAAEAARVAAQQAAARASGQHATPWHSFARPAPAPAAPAPAPARAAAFNLNVWTSGFQAELDACRGAVNLTGHYGVPTIGEHCSCGGARFPRAGSIITLSGVNSGTYRVGGVVAVLNAATQSSSAIPRGYNLLFQTCINGSSATMSFTALTRIG